MWKLRGYAPGVDGPEARDMIAEAGRIARGESIMVASDPHLAAVVGVTAELLAALLEDYDRLQQAACAVGRGSNDHREISSMGRALLARLTGDVGEDFEPRELDAARGALRRIARELDGEVWTPATLDAIAEHVRAAGLDVREPDGMPAPPIDARD